jgi:hypothetical protein
MRYCHCGVGLFSDDDYFCSPCFDYTCEICYPEEFEKELLELESREVNKLLAKSQE